MITRSGDRSGGSLVLEKLTKDYRGFANRLERVAAALSLGWYAGSRSFRSLDHIDLTVEAGCVTGIIGPNGAGKSTLLRLLCGLSTPTSGRVRFSGTIRSILELGVGFNAELTARENVKYNGLLWGYDSSMLREETDAILDFAGLREFSEDPLRTFSTGMQMRLAFSLATHEPADLLLVDEALAVGDASFQQRCFDRFRSYRQAGSIVLVVSHDMSMLVDLADELVLLERGRIIAKGAPASVISAYMQSVARLSFADGQADERAVTAGGERSILSFAMRLLDANGRPRESWFPGEKCILEIELTTAQNLSDLTIGFHFHDVKGLRIFGTNTHLMGRRISLKARERTILRCSLRLNAGPGNYTCGLSIHRGRTHASDCYLWEDVCLDFRVEPDPERISDGAAFFDPQWEDAL